MNETWSPLFGTLDWSSFPLLTAIEHPTMSSVIAAGAGGVAVLGFVVCVIALTWFRGWIPLWRDWLTSLDHKKIGIMYIVLALVMLARAIIEGVLMRIQQAFAVDQAGFLSPEHFGELFSTHGTIMIIFMAMPFVTGVMNYVMPLQIGARDVTFPLLNAVSFMLTAAGAILIMVSLVIGKFSTGGWTAYPPFTGIEFSPGEGVDYWIWAVSLASIGSTLTGINFAVTLYKERCPGMTLMRMPLFCWTTLCTAILMIFAMMPLTVATIMLALDRYAGFHFFTAHAGGNMMNYANLFWLFGHPEVYILILPAFGVFSEVISTYSSKTIYGYKSLVLATMCIAVLSFTVWLHHFFTMGQSANVNAAFGVATMLIGVPTGVKIYDWMLTMYRGRIRLTAGMLFSIYFLLTFVIGGVTGVMLANPTVDFSTHNSLFLVAHFHNMVIPGVLFGMIAATQFWFPKAFGFRLDDGWGRISFAFWSVGFLLTFMPLYALGLMGAMRRTAEWFEPQYETLLLVAAFGALLLLAGFGSLCMQIVVSILRRDTLAAPAGDPWDGRALEWGTSSPPPEYNFAVVPQVASRDAWWEMKRDGSAYRPAAAYEDIELPKNSMVPPLTGLFAIGFGFGFVWHIWWMVIACLILMWVPIICRSFRTDLEKTIPAAQVEAEHRAWLDMVARTPTVTRQEETTGANMGRPEITA